jgi:hypothetical protein
MSGQHPEQDEARAFADLLSVKEPLHEDLRPYLVASAVFPGRKMVHHPLAVEVLYDEAMNALINKRYVHKRDGVAQALKTGDWGRVIAYHERPYRIDALERCVNEGLGGDEFWDHLATVWTDSENIHQHLDTWRELWDMSEPGRIEHVMDEDERARFDALPELVEVWRGYTVEEGLHGMSWTLDKDKGEWFARRFATMEGRKPHLAHAFVPKEKVLAVFLGRNESEVVALPEDVEVKSITVMQRKPER